MPKNINSNPFKTVAVALFAVAMLFAEGVALGQPNPVTRTMRVDFVRNGVEDYEIVAVDGCWFPDYPNWNDKVASDGAKIANIATSLSFPCGTKNITTGEVNDYEDAQNIGGGRIGEPTWSYNCHGHSTGLNYWINENLTTLIAAGDLIKATSIFDANDTCYRRLYRQPGGAHSIAILDTEPIYGEEKLMVREATEKDGYAGTYRFLYPNCFEADWEHVYKR